MATVTNLANYGSASAFVTSYTTGSLSIPASTVLAFIGGVKNSGDATWTATPAFTVSDSVDGATGWVSLGWWYVAGGGGYQPFAQLFAKTFPAPVSRTVTLGSGARTSQAGYNIVAVEGVDTVVQVKGLATEWGDNGNSHSHSVTLDAAPTLGNPVLWMMNANRTSSAQAAAIPAGLTTLINPTVIYQPTAAAWSQATTATTFTSADVGDGVYTAESMVIELSAGAPAHTGGMFFA